MTYLAMAELKEAQMAHEDEYEDAVDLLDSDEFEGLLVDLPAGARFPAIYRGVALPGVEPIGPDDRKLRFGLSIPLEALPPELHHQVMARTSTFDPESGPWVQCRGGQRPEVVPVTSKVEYWEGQALVTDPYASSTVSWTLRKVRREAELKLVELLRRLEARNLSTDRLFVERRLRLEIRGLRISRELSGPGLRHMPDDMMRSIEGKFKLIPTKVWVYLEEDE